MSRCIVVVPTYNEIENIGLLVPQILEQDAGFEVLVVDDDSPDGTGKEADALSKRHPGRVHVLHRQQKEGLGPAYRAGFTRALNEMLEEIEDCDVVLGSRYLKGITVVNWPIERILISYFGNRYAKTATGLPISDITGGFRMMRRAMLERIGFERIGSNGYAFQIELNFRLHHFGARITEIPFFFLDRERGESKLTLRIAVEALWMVWWLRFAKLLGRL